MTPALEEAVRLLRLAHRDRSTLVLLARIPEAPMASLGFHAQQAVEKALKAVSVSRGIETRRTHDLAAGAGQVLSTDAAVGGRAGRLHRQADRPAPCFPASPNHHQVADWAQRTWLDEGQAVGRALHRSCSQGCAVA